MKPNIVTQVTAADYNIYADRRFIFEEFAGGTLKQFLQFVSTYLTGYGVTLDPGQVDGPTLPALSIQLSSRVRFVNEAMTLTAQFGDQFAWEISATKVAARVPTERRSGTVRHYCRWEWGDSGSHRRYRSRTESWTPTTTESSLRWRPQRKSDGLKRLRAMA